jgi:hypothetical protein
MAAPAPLPPLSLSSGPAVSEATSGGTSVTFGTFALNQRREASIFERALPFVAIGGLAWLLTR